MSLPDAPNPVDPAWQPRETFCHYPTIPPPIRLPLQVSPPHPCPYLPDRTAVSRGFLTNQLPSELYRRFMDSGFRRSGRVFYQPVCPGCRECIQLRVPVARFEPSKSQRRCLRQNSDVRLTIGAPAPDEQRFDLYCRYRALRHRSSEETDRQSFESFLYQSPLDSLEFAYRDAGGKLLGIGICDLSAASLSSVYFYFDPEDSSRGLGTFAALREIEFCQAHNLSHYYLGYWVRDCRAMRYKANFRPFELLGPDGIWRSGSENA